MMRLPQDEGIVVSTLDLLRMWLYDETLAVSELSLKFPLLVRTRHSPKALVSGPDPVKFRTG